VNNKILPTHRCFDDALELLEQLVREDAAIATNNTVLLVHGVVRGTVESGDVGRLAHAWLEEHRDDDSTYVWDAGLLDGQRVYFCAEVSEYYRGVRVEPDSVTRYTPRQVLEENRRSGHYGPWRPDLVALIRGRQGSPHEPPKL